MRRLFTIAVVVGVAAAAVQYLRTHQVPALEQFGIGLPSSASSGHAGSGAMPAAPGGAIRIASFNIQVFGTSKLAKPEVMDVLCRIVRNFDIVAIQEIRSADTTVVSQFVSRINAGGRAYDAVVGERLGRTSSKEQYAFIFDKNRVETDPTAVYTVNDPDDLLHREPLVAAFRVRGPPLDKAFTFSLVNIHTDPDETDTEVDALADVFRAVRNDGRHEDDIILLGDLNVDDAHLGDLATVSDLTWVISGIPTNTRRTRQYDNILFHRQATVEYAGRAGVFDFASEYQLTLDQALAVSDHLPVWAEFSPYEGGDRGGLATRPQWGIRR